MRGLRALGIGAVSAVVGAALAIYFGDLGSQAHRMSDFEGGRGMFLAFVVAPAGLIGGLIIGVIFGLRKGEGSAYVLRQLGFAVATTAGIAAGAGGLALLTADHAPTIDGRAIELEFEVRIPATSSLPSDLSSAGFMASLHATDSDNQFAELKFDQIQVHDGVRVISGVAGLNSRVSTRTLLAGRAPSQVFAVTLPPSPTQADFAWSDWHAPTELADGTAVPPAEAFAVRFRVRGFKGFKGSE